MGAIKSKGSWFQAKHNQLRFRLGSFSKATVAIANRMARIIFHIINDPTRRYVDLGAHKVDSSKREIEKAIEKLKRHGLEVTVKPIAEAQPAS